MGFGDGGVGAAVEVEAWAGGGCGHCGGYGGAREALGGVWIGSGGGDVLDGSL